MFNNYQIVEETLYLYLNYNYEFGLDLNSKHKHSNMKKEINKFIKRINFTGEKIVLMLGGIVLATILIVENPKTSIHKLIYVDKDIIPNMEVIHIEKKEPIENKIEVEKKEERVIKEEKKTESKKVSKVIKEEIVESKVEDEKEIKEEDATLKVTVYRANGEVITLPIDEYLIGVVGAEMPASFNIEALKVQAIISRTYTLRSLKINRKLTDTVSTQVYLNNEELREKWGDSFNTYYEKIKKAVFETKDIAIYYNNEYIDALFFATSNGKTEDSKYVWGNSIPYLKSVDSLWDKDTTPYLRTEEKDLENVLNLLGIDNFTFEILSRDESNRVLEIKIADKIYSGVEIRNLLGLRSSDFDIVLNDNSITFTTRGYGHGVGLSQYGANEMAKMGYSYREIIRHYYTGVEVK